MLYKIRATLTRYINGNHTFLSIEKEIGAADETQACVFMTEMLLGFIATDVLISEVTVVRD